MKTAATTAAQFAKGQKVTVSWVEMVSRKPVTLETVVTKVYAPTKTMDYFRFKVAAVRTELVNFGGQQFLTAEDLKAI